MFGRDTQFRFFRFFTVCAGYLEHPFFHKRRRSLKQLYKLKMNWPLLSACHAGRLGDHPTPVGSARLFMHLSSIIRTSVLSPRNLLLTLALLSLRSQTRSSLRHCRFPLCLLTQHSEAFSSSFSLIMLEQLGYVASTGLVQVENQGKGHVGHRCGSSGGYWSSVTISLMRRESSVP